jgi:hypothetical protein
MIWMIWIASDSSPAVVYIYAALQQNAASQKFNIYFFVMPANIPVAITRFAAEVL